MKLVYIAGPFRSTNSNGKSNAWGVQKNVMQAMEVALSIWKAGHVALCPHANTMFFQDADGVADTAWLAGDLLMLDKCDALVTTPNWRESSGAKAEVAHAQFQGIPVFHTVESFLQSLRT